MQLANFQKLNQTQWENIEVPISDYEKKVCEVMKSIGTSNSDPITIDSVEKLEVIGEEIYVTILRPILLKNSFLQLSPYDDLKLNSICTEDISDEKASKSSNNKNKKNKNSKDETKNSKNNSNKLKKLNKEEQMLQSINKDKLEKKLLKLIEHHKFKEILTSQNYEIEQETILEFKLIIFFLMAKNYIELFTNDNRESYLELVIGFSTVIKRLNNELSEYNNLHKENDSSNNSETKNKKNINNNNNLILLNKLKKIKQSENENLTNEAEKQIESSGGSKENNPKFIDHISKKSSIFSTTCLKDFENILTNMKLLANYNAFEVLAIYPKLLISNIVTERYFKIKYVKAFTHQVELVDTLRNSFSEFNEKKNIFKINANLIYLKTPIGSGKTTIAIAIASLIDQIRLKTNLSDYALIFACSIDIVREYVGRIAYNSNISFAVASSFFSEIKLVSSWSCKSVKNVNLIITDYRTAKLLLKKSRNKNYILFIDEPTNKADDRDIDILKTFCALFKVAPPNTILSSATLPSREQMIPFENYFKYFNYANAVTRSISSGHSFIGCQVNCIADFQAYFPHHCCKNVSELLAVYKEAFDDPLVSRFYNSHSLLDLYEKMRRFFEVEGESEIKFKDGLGSNLINLEDDRSNEKLKLPDIKRYFYDIDNMTYAKVVEKCRELLMILINKGDDDIIRQVCQCDSEFCVSNYKRNPNYNPSKTSEKTDYLLQLPTKLAKYFGGGCLIISKDPVAFAEKYFFSFYNKITSTLQANIRKHFQSLIDYQESIKFINNKKALSAKEKEYEISKLTQTSFFSLPIDYVINSSSHFKVWEKENLNSLNSDFSTKKIYNSFDPKNFAFKKPPIIDNNDLKVLSEQEANLGLIALLFGGVGILNNKNKNISECYKRLVTRFAQINELSFIISDVDITFGANFPLNNIIIDDSYNATNHININKVFQLIGRAGRIGQSWSAFAYLDESLIFLIDHKIRQNYFEKEFFNNGNDKIEDSLMHFVEQKNENISEIDDESINSEIDIIKKNGLAIKETDPFLAALSHDILNKHMEHLIAMTEIESSNMVDAFSKINKFNFKFDQKTIELKNKNKKQLVIFNPDDIQNILGIFMIRKLIDFKMSSLYDIRKITKMAFVEYFPIKTEEQLSNPTTGCISFLLKEYSKVYVFDIESNYFKKNLLPVIYNQCEEIVYFAKNKANYSEAFLNSSSTDNYKKLRVISNQENNNQILISLSNIILKEKNKIKEFFEYQKHLLVKAQSNREKVLIEEDEGEEVESDSDKEKDENENSDLNEFEISTQGDQDANNLNFEDWRTKFEYIQNICLEFDSSYFYSKDYSNEDFIQKLIEMKNERKLNNDDINDNFNNNKNNRNNNFHTINNTKKLILDLAKEAEKAKSEDTKDIYKDEINILSFLYYQIFRLERSIFTLFNQVALKIFITNQSKLKEFGELVKVRYDFNSFFGELIRKHLGLFLFNNKDLTVIRIMQGEDFDLSNQERVSFEAKLNLIQNKICKIWSAKSFEDMTDKVFLGINFEKMKFKNAYYLQIRKLFCICDYLGIERKILIISKCAGEEIENKYKLGLLFSGREEFNVDEFLDSNKIRFIGNKYSARFLIKKEDVKSWKII